MADDMLSQRALLGGVCSSTCMTYAHQPATEEARAGAREEGHTVVDPSNACVCASCRTETCIAVAQCTLAPAGVRERGEEEGWQLARSLILRVEVTLQVRSSAL